MIRFQITLDTAWIDVLGNLYLVLETASYILHFYPHTAEFLFYQLENKIKKIYTLHLRIFIALTFEMFLKK